VGKALKGKYENEWEVASEDLKKSQSRHVEKFDDRRNAYACLKLSYDYLKYEETKLCFLLCCLFPEDYYIPAEELTRYAVGYGLYQDVNSIEDARKRVYMEIENLKACCMLLRTHSEEYVKMHDLVRDVAIQIASSEKYGFMVKAGFGLKEWPVSNKSFEGCTVILLMGNKLTKLPEGLVCPQLKVLLLGLDDGLNVPVTFFEGMKAIEVLSLNGGCLSLQSLEFSTKLQSLLLIRCVCKRTSDQMTTHGHGSQKDFLPRLEHVEVNGCRDIRTLFPAKWRQALKNVISVDIRYCKSLEVVFELDEGINEEKELPLLSSLTELQLSRLRKLKCICQPPKSYSSEIESC
jgi:disease resistance protein RPS2